MHPKPSQEVLGERLVDGAAKNYPHIAGVVAGDVMRTMHVQHDRRGRRRKGHDGLEGQRKRPLSMGAELARGKMLMTCQRVVIILCKDYDQLAGTRGRRSSDYGQTNKNDQGNERNDTLI